MPDSLYQRMQQLVSELNTAADAYYNGKGELMTDHEWDAKYDELLKIEQTLGESLPDSPTGRVSADTISGQKEEHEFAALSLAKTKKIEELVKWAEGRKIWISWKLDGLTLVVTYDDGKLSRLVTRGNGHIGTNITHLAPAIAGIPATIAAKGHIVIRGEAVISYDDFDKFLLESGEDYANPRNLASGSLTLKDVNEVKGRHIRWMPFTLVHTPEDIVSWGERMEWLDKLGFLTVSRQQVGIPTIENVEKCIDEFTRQVTTRQNPYPVDGLVVCYDDTDYAATGSVTGHHATRAGLAFKWQDEEAQTTLETIEWSCAAQTISPVAIFKPVELEGTTVRRASLCNISECERLGIGGPGSYISVIKANKIIPKVVRVSQAVGKLDIPEHCPVCHAPTEIKESQQSGTRTLHCTNIQCPAKKLRKFARFVSKEGMNIDGISEQTLAKFINQGWVTDYSDIFALKEYIRKIAAMEGFGDKSAANIVNAIEKARSVEPVHLLYALSIPLCGIDVCKRLLSEYSLEELVSEATGTTGDLFAAQRPAEEVFANTSGIGPEKSAAFVTWFRNPDNLASYNKLLSQLTIVSTEPTVRGTMLEGKTFVITGDVHHFKNRNELKAFIESQGGKVASAVSGSTSFLINNDATSTSGKNKKAQTLGIPVITEDEFLSMTAE